MNIRTHFGLDVPYYKINREERNFAAIFYHVLLSKNNLQRFLEYINCDHVVDPLNFGIYFEYAFIRDLWDFSKGSNDQKKEYILNAVQLKLVDNLAERTASILSFNKLFGVALPSSNFVQSPSNWSIQHYDKNIPDNEEFLRITKFKWCFNAKPDIVIHTSSSRAICLEAKVVSGEGQYPGSSPDKAIFRRRGLGYVRQREIQKMLMEDLLGLEVTHKYLVKEGSGDDEVITWKDIFKVMDYTDSPKFIQSWIKSLM